MTLLIGIAGKDGVGKSTLAGNLATKFGDSAVLAVATGLRRYCVDKGLLTFREAFTKPTSSKARRILRATSTNVKEAIGDKEVWLKSCRESWRFHSQHKSTLNAVVIHDIRYKVEAEALLEDGGLIVYMGSAELTDEQQSEPSFKDLPYIWHHLTDYTMGEKPDQDAVNTLFQTLLWHK